MLNIDPVVQVNVQVGTSSASAGTFDVGAILTSDAGTASGTGGGAVLSTTHRYAVYKKLSEVLNGVTDEAPAFANTTDTYKAAAKYFGVDPAPAKLVVVFYDTASETTDTPTLAMLDAIDKGAEFYAVYYAPKTGTSASDVKTNIISIASALTSLARGVEFYGATGTVSSLVSSGGMFKDAYNTKSDRMIGMYCTSEIDDAAGLMGLSMGLSRRYSNGTFALCFKSIASATVNGISQTEVASIKEVNGNVYVARTKDRAGVENGATPSGLRFDDVLYIDSIAHEIQVSLYNLIANSVAKLPQNNSTTVLFESEITRILENYYNRGILADNPWRGASVADVETGDIIEHGYHLYADVFDNQSAEDRAARKAMPITVLLCLNGSVESIVINLDIQT